jgi:hypothetical protein
MRHLHSWEMIVTPTTNRTKGNPKTTRTPNDFENLEEEEDAQDEDPHAPRRPRGDPDGDDGGDVIEVDDERTVAGGAASAEFA